MKTAREKALQFVREETAFHLGALPTEQPHGRTVGLAESLQADTRRGVRAIQAVDRDIPAVATRALASPELRRLRQAIVRALLAGGRVFFTGCGATGRLSILLEACWRRFWSRRRAAGGVDARVAAELEERVFSIMAGGDFALIRSVEGFEDFTDFGRYQAQELGVREGDVLVAITEGGETSFVIGTAWQAVETGADTFFVFNNPADVLAAHVERSREVIADDRITKIDLATGPMAVAGSTRMQATTVELLVVGAALELALLDVAGELLPADTLPPELRGERAPTDYGELFETLLDDLSDPANVDPIAAMVELEEQVYREQGLLTYFADEYLLDLLTDTTERSPTFLLPPFRPDGDIVSPPSWAFVKNPLLATPEAWRELLGREIRGLDWDAAAYRSMGAPASLISQPPALDRDEILRFRIGCEPDDDRRARPASALAWVLAGREVVSCAAPGTAFRTAGERFASRPDGSPVPVLALAIGPGAIDDAAIANALHVRCELPASPLDLAAHLAVKLVLNTVSTATMGRLGRLASNWMVYVQPSNKKLIDRATRLIAELASVDYDEACIALHESIEWIAEEFGQDREKPPPVVVALERLRRG